MNTAAFWQSK